MAVYEVYDKDGNFENIIMIDPAYVTEWEELTGLTLKTPPEPEYEESETPDPAVMEEALTKMGVELYEEG